MKSTSIFLGSELGGYSSFTIFRYIVGVLLLFNSISVTWARTPQAAKVAFTSSRDGNLEIYVMNSDGSDQVNLTRNNATDYDPAWSPNGEEILFISDRDGPPDLYTMKADGSSVRRVFRNREFRADPVWSPDGRKIAYTQGEEKDAAIYVSTINGGATQKLTDGFMPSWSPDGSEIVFSGVTGKGSPLSVWTLPTRIKKTLLPNKMPWIVHPTWSPRGDKIVFSQIDGRFNQDFLEWTRADIYIVNRDGTGLHQVIKNEGAVAMEPTWSPDGDELIYTDAIKHRGLLFTQLFKTDLNGHNPIQLTDEGDNFRADWYDPIGLDVSPSEQLLTTVWGKVKAD